jgi:hypothetical protein
MFTATRTASKWVRHTVRARSGPGWARVPSESQIHVPVQGFRYTCGVRRLVCTVVVRGGYMMDVPEPGVLALYGDLTQSRFLRDPPSNYGRTTKPITYSGTFASAARANVRRARRHTQHPPLRRARSGEIIRRSLPLGKPGESAMDQAQDRASTTPCPSTAARGWPLIAARSTGRPRAGTTVGSGGSSGDAAPRRSAGRSGESQAAHVSSLVYDRSAGCLRRQPAHRA